MLVLSRGLNQGIRIGKDVRIVVVETRGNKVRLGIEAPSDVDVDRDEIFEAKQRDPRNKRRNCA
jgi:carbon storage regulator